MSAARTASLTYGMIIGVALFALAGSLALLWVFANATDREERAAFEALARADAGFLDQSSLPRSVQMASQLSRVTGADIFFKHALTGSVVGAVPPDAVRLIEDTAPDGRVHQEKGQWIVAHSLRDGTRAFFMRTAPDWMASLERKETWLALAGFWSLSVILAAWQSHRIAKPLRALARAVPDVGGEGPLPAMPINRPDEIGQLARSLVSTHDSLLMERERRRAAERLALLGQMAASLAHEVRNPVTAIKLHAQLIAGASASDARASLGLIEAEASRIESLVQQWLIFAKPAPPVVQPVRLDDLIHALIIAMEPQAKHANVNIHLRSPATPTTIAADAHRARQAFTNVINNAIQAMPLGGELSITIAEETSPVTVSIDDTGPGFSATALARLGEPFYSEKEGGMGLGLAVSRDICEAHGGTLIVESRPAGGARVRLSFG